MSTLYNGMPWFMYLIVTFGSSIVLFVVAGMSFMRRKPFLITIGFFILGCAGVTIALAKIFNLLNLYWYANASSAISITCLLVGLPIAMVGGIKAAKKENPKLHKSLVKSATIMSILFILVIVIVLIQIVKR